MSIDDRRLKEAWKKRAESGARSAACPDPERIWLAVTLESAADERLAVIAHIGSCSNCAESWRIAARLAGQAGQSSSATSRATSALRQLALAAASIIVVLGLGWFALQYVTPEDGTLRATEPSIVSLVEDARALPRDRFTLRWTPGPPGSIYDVEVGTTELRRLSRGVALTTPEYLVPMNAFEGIESGTPIAWRVEATLPDGRVIASVTYVNGVN